MVHHHVSIVAQNEQTKLALEKALQVCYSDTHILKN